MAGKKKNVKIYTDGACSGNPGSGGWAAILLHGGHEKVISGYDPDTTNNRMELTAAIEGLKALNTMLGRTVFRQFLSWTLSTTDG